MRRRVLRMTKPTKSFKSSSQLSPYEVCYTELCQILYAINIHFLPSWRQEIPLLVLTEQQIYRVFTLNIQTTLLLLISILSLYQFIRNVRDESCNLRQRMTKPTKWHVHPVMIQISLGINLSLIRVFAVHLKLGSLATH